jgi:hypothetical protein
MKVAFYVAFCFGLPLTVLIPLARADTLKQYLRFAAVFFIAYYAVWTILFVLISPGD